MEGNAAPDYEEGAAFLKNLGMDQATEIARVLDIAMNPNSLFRERRRTVNANVRRGTRTTSP